MKRFKELRFVVALILVGLYVSTRSVTVAQILLFHQIRRFPWFIAFGAQVCGIVMGAVIGLLTMKMECLQQIVAKWQHLLIFVFAIVSVTELLAAVYLVAF